MKTKFMGRYVITDPEICHGKPTFRGTRILVADVLEQVADGLAWETIIERSCKLSSKPHRSGVIRSTPLATVGEGSASSKRRTMLDERPKNDAV